MSIYKRLGVEPIINASGTVTRLGGAPMPDAVLDAMREAAGEAVPLEQLQAAACQRIAKITGAQAGLVTSGSAAALTLGAAAILSGLDLGRMECLPQTDGFPNEFVIAREQRSGYDHAIRAAGAKLVEVGFNEIVSGAGVRRTEAWEYEAAFGPNTAGVVYVHNSESRPSLPEVVHCAHAHGLPVLVDAAGELPPRSNLTDIVGTSADLVAFSGGKAIRGPQATGILCGRRDLISAAALQMLDMDDHYELWNPPKQLIDKTKFKGIPRHGFGRGFKVAKEEIVGLLTALELFASGAYDDELPQMRDRLRIIADNVESSVQSCEIEDGRIHADDLSEHEFQTTRIPLLIVTLQEGRRAAFEVCRQLRDGTPPIYVGHGRLDRGQLVIHPLSFDNQQAKTLAGRLLEVLQTVLSDSK